MAVNKTEALVDAIARLNQIHNPESVAYRLRSPLLVKSFGRLGKHSVDEEGRRVFTSLLAGYKAAVFDAGLKISGKSRAKLQPTDVLESLLGVYGHQGKVSLDHVISFLRRALDDQNISNKTPLSYFTDSLPEERPS